MPAAEKAGAYKLAYEPPGPVLRAFMRSNAFVRGVRGPVGSAKSSACCVELFRRGLQQEKGADGLRHTRWVIVRNTGPELKTTTIKTWLDWFPEQVFGKFNWSPPFTHHIRKAEIDLEAIFLALDNENDVKKLLSLEVTGGWINEAREVPKAVLDGLTMRAGRFPSMKDGGPTWRGIIMDTNAMEPDHWWPILSGESPVPEDMAPEDAALLAKPDDWEFFNQPPGMIEMRDSRGEVVGYDDNPDAENAKNLVPGYYRKMIAGKTRSWISIYVCNKLGSTTDGKVVYPSFREDKHVAVQPILPVPNLPLLVGVDFGLTPAAVIGQNLRGRFIIQRELVATDMGAKRFSGHLREVLSEMMADQQRRGGGIEPPGVSLWGDPAGDQRAQSDETTPFEIFRAAQLPILPAPTNDPVMRIESVTLLLERMVDGETGIVVNPACRVLRAGFARGYSYPKIQVSGGPPRYGDTPLKNRFSHVHDALQYLVLGAGVGRQLIARPKGAKSMVVAKPGKSFFARRAAR